MATSLIVLSPSVGAVAPYERWDQGTPPALSAANTARVYFDSVSKTLKLSNNGGAYFDIATGSASPWNNTTTAGYITENTIAENVIIGNTVSLVTSRKLYVHETGADKGIQVQSALNTDNVLDFYNTTLAYSPLSITGRDVSIAGALADVAPRIKIDGGSTSGEVSLGDGSVPLDTVLSRITGPLLNVNVGAQFGGDIQRFESAWTVKTLRTLTDGAGDDITLKAADALATAPGSYAGGKAHITAGQAIFNTAGGANGGDVIVTSGNGVSDGATSGNGGPISLVTGIGAGPTGVSGDIICGDSSSNGSNVRPSTDQTGAIGKTGSVGTSKYRWDSFVSSDDRKGGFVVRPTLPTANPLATLSGISHPRSVIGLAMGPGSTAVDVRMQRDVLTGGGSAKFAFYGGTTMTRSASLIPGIDAEGGGLIGNVSDPTDIRRWNSVYVSNGYNVYNGLVSPAFAQAEYGTSIKLGDGTVSVDLELQRISFSAVPYFMFGDIFSSTGAGLVPFSDSSGDIGLCNASDCRRWNSVVANNHDVFSVLNDVNPQARLTGDVPANGGQLLLGFGGAFVPDTRIHHAPAVGGLPTLRIDDNAAGAVNVLPGADNVGNIGDANNRWQLVRAVTITSGDMCFDDERCQICGQNFEEGDDLVLRVIRIEPDGNTGRRLTRTVPAHHGCK